jgi:hypothetical protein
VAIRGDSEGQLALPAPAEFQARGLVLFHVIVRLDGTDDRAMAPGVSVTAEELCGAIRDAVARSSLTGHAGDGTVELRFGEQLHTRVLAGAGREPCARWLGGSFPSLRISG